MTVRYSPGRVDDDPRSRRRSGVAIKESLRELSIALSLLNHRVGARLDLKDVDLDCLDLINRHGPLSPSALARRAGWVARERDPSDRRAVVVRGLRRRNAELFDLYSGMNSSMDQLCERYSGPELDLLADFLRRTADAGRVATEDLAAD